ncbi:hypothetical protein G7Y79_00011g030050 [Physcia stellaris]|nr:hypothetical protein G7Y79_00011g030050 [Physcia stellaris]
MFQVLRSLSIQLRMDLINPLGTSFILDDHSRSHTAQQAGSNLKYDNRAKVPVILVPQPTDDPNDPLNWPLWKRDAILLILSTISVIASTLSPLLAANTVTLSLIFERDFTQTALLTGYHLCGVGIAGLLFVASARVWGKRHLYLLGTILIIISSAWGGASGSNYKSLLWARIIQGVGLAPFEALVNASVGDLYFVHERGKRMALSNLALFGGAFFTPVIVGKITHTIGWQWSFYLIAIFAGVLLPLVFFFCPETTFREAFRPPHYTSKETFIQSLALFNGRKTSNSFWKLLLRPFPIIFHPAVLWAMLIQGTLIGWTVMIGVMLAAVFLGPPLWFTEVKTGYMYTGPFIGALLGFAVSGLLADWSARFMIKRNKGVYEPEFRIVLVVAQLVFGCVGLYGFGATAANVKKFGWFWPDFFFALEVMGMVLGAVASALYIVDAHREIAVEAFTCLLVFKNLFSFGLTWSAYDWLKNGGVARIFYIIASVQLVVCLLSIPMYILGKKNRAFFARHDILKMTGLS